MKKTFGILLVTLLMQACTTNPTNEIFSPDNPSMASILGSSDHSQLTFSEKAHSRDESIAHNGANNPNKNVFRELNNPTISVYIEPHKTQNGTFLPGIVVPVKRYDRVVFALPGER